MATRTKEQILDEAVFAAACVAQHYGPGFSEEGLAHLRALLSQMPWSTDSTYRCDVDEKSLVVDFHQRIIWPLGWDKLSKDEVCRDSVTAVAISLQPASTMPD